MDGACTGNTYPNDMAIAADHATKELLSRRTTAEGYPDLRPVAEGVGQLTLDGTRAAVSTVIRYRNGVLNGKGASLLDGYMEDLATDRIYRLMIAQRVRHKDVV